MSKVLSVVRVLRSFSVSKIDDFNEKISALARAILATPCTPVGPGSHQSEPAKVTVFEKILVCFAATTVRMVSFQLLA